MMNVLKARIKFQSTLPRGERPGVHTAVNIRGHFNPRSRVGSDRRNNIDLLRFVISIHAPAWGATKTYGGSTMKKYISIHAPAWGATGERSGLFMEQLHFNPRSRVGSDIIITSRSSRDIIFQSTLPRGERQIYVNTEDAEAIFQSTLPRGERQLKRYHKKIHGDFNPRSRVGSDWCEAFGGSIKEIFQSTLPRGERRLYQGIGGVTQYFNPRSRVGSDTKPLIKR